MINSVSLLMPAVGRSVIAEIVTSLVAMMSIAIIIKIYKLIPFKAT